MKNRTRIILIWIAIILVGVLIYGYQKLQETRNISHPAVQGILQGSVTVGPVCTEEIIRRFPTYSCKPTPEMYAAAKVIVYMPDKLTLVTTISPDKDGKFSINLNEGEYFIDMIHQRMGGTKGVPVTITIAKDKPVTLKLEVDTGLR